MSRRVARRDRVTLVGYSPEVLFALLLVAILAGSVMAR